MKNKLHSIYELTAMAAQSKTRAFSSAKKVLRCCICTAFIAAGHYTADAQIMSTVAGNGVAAYYGDDGPATDASLYQESGAMVTDAAGNLYIADESNHMVRKVSAAGIITRFAGTGTPAFSGDGGPATAAELNGPMGLAIDAAGNIYIGDVNNSRVRKVTTAGIISTVAGDGTVGYSGDGGPATAAQFIGVYNVAVDGSGNLYITDVNNHRIRKVDAAGIIYTFAGNGIRGYAGDGGPATAAEFDEITGIAFDGSNNLYVSDQNNNRIRIVSPAGIINTFAGTGTAGYSADGTAATAANLYNPNGVCVDVRGNVYISDLQNDIVRKVNTSGLISTVAGMKGIMGYTGDGGDPTAATMNAVGRICVDASRNLYITDILNRRVRMVSACALPSAGLIAGTDSVCPAHSVTLTDATPGGTWLSTNTAKATISGTGTVTGVTSGSVNIAYVVANSCGTDTTYFPFKVRTTSACTPTGAENAASSVTTSLTVFPNPNSGTFAINIANPYKEDIAITITNVLGEKVKEVVVNGNKDVEVSLNVAPGIYYLSAMVNGEKLVKKIVIE